VEWDIYVNDDELLKGIDESTNIQTSEIRCGHWSQQRGVKRGPIYPSDDFKRMESIGTAVLELLKSCHDQLPFPLRDNYELWLLDQLGLPLCLIDSAVFPRELSKYRDLTWRPGQLCQCSFKSAYASDAAQRLTEPSEDESAANILKQQINQQSHKQPQAQWFLRRSEPVSKNKRSETPSPPVSNINSIRK